ncbi:MAG: tripartite tricarboxylate transporter substrate binding protein [Deltaproteobacteria bacterium]|nr:tripartite tricarboxylate transporter substrate binding protein [Deltaproteobacteria bacterium]
MGLLSLAVVAAVGLLAAGQWSAAGAWEPKGQLECIAPANPGGGWDAVCRSTSSALQKSGIVKETMYVTNMPGGSGAVAIANVITKRKGDTNLLVAASNALTFTMALNRTTHTYKDIIPIAQIGAEIGGFFVKSDSKYKNLADLINALKADPKSVTFCGGSAPGGQDHIKAALFAKAIGVEPTKIVYVPYQGGGEALTSLLGGHTEVGAIDISEAAGQFEAGKVRCLGLLSEKRSTKFKDIPTTYEQGVKVSYPIWRGVYMAPGTPTEAVKFWSEAIQKMVATPEWAAEREKMGWEPTYRFGDDFDKFVTAELATFKDLLKELGFLK